MTNKATKQTFRMLRIICSSDEALGVAELGRRADVHVSTAHRSLAALEQTGYIARVQQSSKYVPGNMTAQLVRALCERYAVRSASVPYLQQLALATDRETSLYVKVGWYAVCVAIVEAARGVYDLSRLTERHLLHEGSASLAMAAFQEEKQLQLFLEFLRRRDAALLPDWSRKSFQLELRKVRKQGYAEEDTPVRGLRRVALPVLAERGHAVAAITVEGIREDGGSERVRHCASIVAELNKVIAAKPRYFADPFGHIDPSAIVFS
jgi:DNA-binding IclR family transcriptional regulator